ncbi:hypothetical protein NDU88_000899 [Pleurodeles waltl]|uniref:Secreted protein n=1 Tax=Pleurodeles waltl TaxID=8319 RepID=A0AAV7U7R4_PLEWA|nr:hypothetical protein NDU88_000899 [Pleurodeles waltl]
MQWGFALFQFLRVLGSRFFFSPSLQEPNVTFVFLRLLFFGGYSVVDQHFNCLYYPGPGGPLGTSRLLPRLSKGLCAFQGGTGGSQSVCAPPQLIWCSADRTWHQQGGDLETKQPRGQAAIHRLQEPRPSSRSRPRLLRVFNASSARASPSVVTRRGRTPRTLCGAAVRQPLQPISSLLCPLPPPSR